MPAKSHPLEGGSEEARPNKKALTLLQLLQQQSFPAQSPDPEMQRRVLIEDAIKRAAKEKELKAWADSPEGLKVIRDAYRGTFGRAHESEKKRRELTRETYGDYAYQILHGEQ